MSFPVISIFYSYSLVEVLTFVALLLSFPWHLAVLYIPSHFSFVCFCSVNSFSLESRWTLNEVSLRCVPATDLFPVSYGRQNWGRKESTWIKCVEFYPYGWLQAFADEISICWIVLLSKMKTFKVNCVRRTWSNNKNIESTTLNNWFTIL